MFMTQFDRIFDFGRNYSNLYGGKSYPNFIVNETKEAFEITAMVPGYSKDELNVDVVVEDGYEYLVIKGDVKEENKFQKSFTKMYSLPENIKKEKIEAKYENGVLTVVINKKEKDKPKELKIKIK
jgi:HSP20 family protein